MSLRVLVESAFLGINFETLAAVNREGPICESGILGGDMIPKNYVQPTLKHIENELDKIAIELDDDVQIKTVGSIRFASETRSVFGDLDVILRVRKPETLSRIKVWVSENKETTNVRDIQSKKSGDSLDPDNMGDQFSFLYPIYDESGKKLDVGEIRSNLKMLAGQPHMTYRDNHDQRLKIDANVKNLTPREANEPAYIQIDVMRVLVDGQEFDGLVGKAQKLAKRLEEIQLDDALQDADLNGDGKIQGPDELKAWLKNFLDGEEVDEFEHHYNFLKKHGELQGNDDQTLLAAIHLLSSEGDFDGKIGKRFDSIGYRYGFHPDSLQLIYFLANQLGMPLDDDNFNEETLQRMLDMAKVVTTETGQSAGLKQTSVNRVDAGAKQPAQGIVSDKLDLQTMRNPAEFFRMLKGKMKEEAKGFVINNTKNKRADEANPDALFKNFGTRRVKKI